MRRLPFNKAIRLMLYTNALILAATYMLGPIYAFFVEEVGGDVLDASLAFATLAVTAGVFTVLSGRYADKIKENELIIVLGYTVVAIGFIGYIFVSSIWGLLVVQIVIGIGEAIWVPAFDSVYSKHLTPTTAGTKWAAWEFLNYIMKALGAVLGGSIVALLGFDVMFATMAALCLFAAFFVWLQPRSLL